MDPPDNGVDTISVQASASYTDPGGLVQSDSGSQSVQTAHTHGTHGSQGTSNRSHPNSPKRGQHTPLTTSPASVSASQAAVHPDVLGTLEPMPPFALPHTAPPRSSHLQQRQQQQQPNDSGFLLGMQQLERQALDHPHGQHMPVEVMHRQQQQRQQPQLHQPYPANRERSNPVSDDEHTEQSSSVNTSAENTTKSAAGGGYTRSDAGATSTFGRLIQSATKSINSRGNNGGGNTARKASQDEEGFLEGALIYGYLQKMGRNGKWQTRWFETDGECLTYYKSSKRVKLLATLDLAKVGSIVINHEDDKGCCFTINISERPYHLRADSKAACKDWVITLNRVKEARMEVGHVKLAMPDATNNPPDLLDQDYTPRVVVVANRQRTHAVEDDEMHSWEVLGGADENNPFQSALATSNIHSSKYGDVAPATAKLLARWQKPRNSISLIANKVIRWARSLRKFRCSDAENQVVLDHHLHPPGHDDPQRGRATGATGRGKPYPATPGAPMSSKALPPSAAADPTPPAWIQNKNSVERPFPPSVVTTTDLLDTNALNQTGSPRTDNADDDDEETRELS